MRTPFVHLHARFLGIALFFLTAWFVMSPAVHGLGASSQGNLSSATKIEQSGSLRGLKVRYGSITDHADWRFWELSPDLDKLELRIAKQDGGGSMLESLIATTNKDKLVAILNGGYFMRNFEPTGWVRDSQKTYSKKRQTKKGGVIAIKGENLYIGAQDEIPFEPIFVIHNSPLLLDKGAHIALRSDDGRRAARTVACIKQETKKASLHFVLILAPLQKGPTLMETAKLLQESPTKGGFGCDSALNLDGGPSSGVWLNAQLQLPSEPPIVPIGYGIMIQPPG